ncbi:MAG: CvpA family protein [Chloroflexi bacterium]|nr:CvpA family protein [Chloroflexota bacterium]
MNIVDFIILGAVGLVALLGLKAGFLKPVSGIGGLILGVMVAIQQHGEVAALLVGYIDKELWRNVAGFIAVVLVATLVTRAVAFMVKKLLSALALGWADHVVGAVGGAALGLVIVSTALVIASGVDNANAQTALAGSVIAPEISSASLISSSTPWCSAQPDGAASGGCADFKGLLTGLIGTDVKSKVGGPEAGRYVGAMKGDINGTSTEEYIQLANAQ